MTNGVADASMSNRSNGGISATAASPDAATNGGAFHDGGMEHCVMVQRINLGVVNIPHLTKSNDEWRGVFELFRLLVACFCLFV